MSDSDAKSPQRAGRRAKKESKANRAKLEDRIDTMRENLEILQRDRKKGNKATTTKPKQGPGSDSDAQCGTNDGKSLMQNKYYPMLCFYINKKKIRFKVQSHIVWGVFLVPACVFHI